LILIRHGVAQTEVAFDRIKRRRTQWKQIFPVAANSASCLSSQAALYSSTVDLKTDRSAPSTGDIVPGFGQYQFALACLLLDFPFQAGQEWQARRAASLLRGCDGYQSLFDGAQVALSKSRK
jgi:hypothetical protein